MCPDEGDCREDGGMHSNGIADHEYMEHISHQQGSHAGIWVRAVVATWHGKTSSKCHFGNKGRNQQKSVCHVLVLLRRIR